MATQDASFAVMTSSDLDTGCSIRLVWFWLYISVMYIDESFLFFFFSVIWKMIVYYLSAYLIGLL